MKKECSLCELTQITDWYDDTDQRFVVIECSSCNTPMVVWKAHTLKISPQDAYDMFFALADVADEIIGQDRWYLRTQQGSILDHLHWHAENKKSKNPKCKCRNIF